MTHPDLDRCDLCGSSISREEFEKGHAVRVFGKTYCPACRDEAIHEAKSLEEPVVAPRLGPSPGKDHPHRRRHERKAASLPVELSIYLEDGGLHNRGKAVLRNVSLGGALLGSILLEEKTLPSEPHTIGIRPFGVPTVQSEIVGRPVRLVHRTEGLEVGMEFLSAQEEPLRMLLESV